MIQTLLRAGAVAGVLMATSAHAVVVFSDNFDSDAYVLNFPGDADFTSVAVPSTSGNHGVASTDLVGPGFYSGLCGNGTRCVDLDGTTGSGNTPSGELVSKQTFGPGSYKLSFALNGNRRGAPAQTTTVTLDGQTVASFVLASNAPYTVYNYNVTTTGTGTLDFIESGPSSQQGALLDNVVLSSPAPEPASWALMILGVAGIGGGVRIRRQAREERFAS